MLFNKRYLNKKENLILSFSSLFFEFGDTIVSYLADFSNYSYIIYHLIVLIIGYFFFKFIHMFFFCIYLRVRYKYIFFKNVKLSTQDMSLAESAFFNYVYFFVIILFLVYNNFEVFVFMFTKKNEILISEVYNILLLCFLLLSCIIILRSNGFFF